MKEKIIRITFCSLFILIISVMGILTIINDDKVSKREGRKLAQFPEVTIKGLLGTDYYTNLTNAFSDQMAFRNQFITIYYLANLQRYTGDVVKADNDELFLAPQTFNNKEKTLENIAKVTTNYMNKVAKEVTEEGSKFIFISIPRKDVMMEKYLPSSYIAGTDMYIKSINTIKENADQNVVVIDTYELLKDKVDRPFYKTDHHMNIRGAYVVFENIISYVNDTSKSNIKIGTLEEEYEIKKQIVNGAFNRKIGQSVKADAEELNLRYIGGNVTYTRYEDGKLSDIPVFGDKNTYASAYMGDDMAETVIDTNNDDAPNILFVGSSYTNILEALSVHKFNKMVSIDYRHNKTGKSIADYVKEYDIDYTIYICSQSTGAFNIGSMKEHLGVKD